MSTTLKFSLMILLMCVISLVSFHSGAYFERRYIIQTIRAGQARGSTKLIKVPQLKMTLIPFEKGFISWND
jgi:hypothetical protein